MSVRKRFIAEARAATDMRASDRRSPSSPRTRPAAALISPTGNNSPVPWFNDEVCNVANMRGDGNTSAGESLDKCNRLTFEAGWQQKYVMLGHDACDPVRRNDPEETYPVHLAGEKAAQLRIIRSVARNGEGQRKIPQLAEDRRKPENPLGGILDPAKTEQSQRTIPGPPLLPLERFAVERIARSHAYVRAEIPRAARDRR